MASGKNSNVGVAALTEPGLRFPIQFLLAASICAGIFARWNQAVAKVGCDVTLANAKALGALFGLNVAGSGDILSVNGFAMRIIFECTAIHYIVILALAILLYTRHGIRYRLAGVTASTVIVLAVNALRLVVTGLIGSVSSAGFRFVHEYLWVALFALLVFSIWKVWADGGLMWGKDAVRQAALMTATCSLVFLLLFACKELYCRVLAGLASTFLKLLLSDPQASVVWNGHLEFSQGGAVAQFGTFFELANLAVYLGLVLPKLREGRNMVLASLLGLALLLIVYAEFIAFLGITCLRHPESSAIYQGTGAGIFLALPMAMYWIVVKFGGERGRERSQAGSKSAAP